ncbi:MAG: cytochrome c4 [Polaromonas sp.]|nr:cytochrome c4 [Polaromonas sp.]
MKLFVTSLLAACLALPVASSFAQSGGAPAAPATGAPAAAAATAAAPGTTTAEAPPAPPAPAGKPDLVKGEASFAAVCVACHGAEGNSGIPANPKLAQQHPEYLVKQLQDYKSGKRKNPIMQGIASALSESDMRNISYWAGEKKIKPGFAKDKELVALGERIYRGGVADRQIAACAGCHNPTGAGIPAQYPRLGGQHAEYVATQLTQFRDGVRTNSLQMNQIAAKLNDREIKALSDYIAGLR